MECNIQLNTNTSIQKYPTIINNMNTYRLITTNPVALVTVQEKFPLVRKKNNLDGVWLPDGLAYTLDEPFPTDTPSEGKYWVKDDISYPVWGWIEDDLPEVVVDVPEQVDSWQLRVVSKVTPYGGETLYDHILSALDAIPDPVEKIAAQEIFNTNGILYRDSVLLTGLASGLGMDDLTVDNILIQAGNINF